MICWICRNIKPKGIRIEEACRDVCKDCYRDFDGKIKLCVGYSGRECSNPVLGERVDEGYVRCEECQEHFFEENPDAECDEE